MHRIGTAHDRAVTDDLDAGLFEIGDTGAFEPGDFIFLVGDKGGSVKARIDLPAKAGGHIKQIMRAACIDIEFFWEHSRE
ncbi:MAG: hypothetical protein MO852_14085 [Candidatus Devosia euplotis]|nr:hypothetical protein [Candidatus Devosia euplotis]